MQKLSNSIILKKIKYDKEYKNIISFVKYCESLARIFLKTIIYYKYTTLTNLKRNL